nr:trypsin-like peptidase domain-containing protein [uncultured Carboxylicivirga sp.]
MLKQILILLFLISCLTISGQISHGGFPSEILPENAVELISEPSLAALKKDVSYGNGPLRYAYPIYVDYTLLNSGKLYDYGDGTLVWQLVLKSDGAKTLSVNFSHFRLVDEASVFIYNVDKSEVLGSFTSANNKPSGKLATAPLTGEEIIIELQTKQENFEKQELAIGEVFHDFLGVKDYLKNNIDFGDSQDCNVDVNCDARIPNEIKRSVVKYISQGYLCSGILVNNTNNDGKPYVLTAAHCIINQSEAENMLVYFNFDAPICEGNVAGTDQQQLSGANFIAGVKNMDFSLVELSSIPPATYRPYWAGWDLSTSISDPVYCVHHPEGDVKKVSWSRTAPENATYNDYDFISDGHWLIRNWVSGTTEGGSSGSGLFTQDNKLIGTLSGGYASCDYPHEDYFARFNKAWGTHSETSMHLSTWLNPSGEVVSSIDGFDYYKGVMKRVSSATDETFPVVLYSDEFKGPWSGNNSRRYSAFAEHFYNYEKATIYGLYIVPAICNYSFTTSVNIKIWNSIGGIPADVVFAKNQITLAEFKLREYYLELSEPLTINGKFFIGIELNEPASADTFALYNVKKNIGEFVQNRAFIRDNGAWKGLDELNPSVGNTSFWIDFMGSDLSESTEEDPIETVQVIIRPNPSRDGNISFVTNMEHLSSVELYSINGIKVNEYACNGEKRGNLTIPPFIKQGVYIAVFKNAVSSISQKVLILT